MSSFNKEKKNEKKHEKKKDHEPTSAEISMKAKQGEGAYVEEYDEEGERLERKESQTQKNEGRRK